MSQNKPTIRQYILSVLALAVGVQSGKARERDSRGSLIVFIIGGLIFVLLFVATLMVIANWIAAMA